MKRIAICNISKFLYHLTLIQVWIGVCCLMVLFSCIKPYDPEILTLDENKLVVYGQVNAGDSIQRVNVSISSSINDPKYEPVTGCHIFISDDRGHSFPMLEKGNGDYETFIDPVFLIPGAAFNVLIAIPGGGTITSDFDTLTHGPPVDSVYYIRKDFEGNTVGDFTRGIQFYSDMNTGTTESLWYRWEAIETYEYHTDYPIEWYYDGHINQVIPPDYSKHICWRTLKVPYVFTLSTRYFQPNASVQVPLHYVDNRTTRLAYGYSLLIRQYSLSEAGFIYWDQLRINSEQQAGLYEKQPLGVRGNIHNVTHPEEEVLGFFGASTLSTKRIFVYPVPGLPLDYNTFCVESDLVGGLGRIKPKDYPVYLKAGDNTFLPIVLERECVNCLYLHGTIIKPSFWPN